MTRLDRYYLTLKSPINLIKRASGVPLAFDVAAWGLGMRSGVIFHNGDSFVFLAR